jgi:uncharacterized protein YggE
MRHTLKRIALGVGCVLMIGALAGCAGGTGASERTIVVSATGQASVSPDMGYVTYQVVTESNSAQDAQQKNQEKSDAIAQAIVALGVEEKDLVTVDYSLGPDYEYINNRQTLRAYVCRNTVKITVRDIARIGAVMEAAVPDNGSQLQAVSFDVSDKTAAYAAALGDGVIKAKSKAEAMAAAGGVVLGEVVTLTDSIGYDPYPIYENAAKQELAADLARGISTGDLTVTVQVSAVYRIR